MSEETKRKYLDFEKLTYIPIYSKSWWMDAICGPDNWDVWLYEDGGRIDAAMPYYFENRGTFKYITKAKLTQNNGILFRYPPSIKLPAKAAFEEHIINEACRFIHGMKIAVYEQQYHYSFQNWLPFYWRHYTAIPRYTYVINNTDDLNAVWGNLTSKCRSIIKKGQRNAKFDYNVAKDIFFLEHIKVFSRHGLPCPFSETMWDRLYEACKANEACQIIIARDIRSDTIASVMFLVWDDESVYLLLGGNMPDLQNLDTYAALIWEGIKFAGEKNLKFDFEGSVIERISKSFREYGAIPQIYFRIRKVFNPDIIRDESEQAISTLAKD